MIEDEDLLMAVLNSAPVIAGRPSDALASQSGKAEFTKQFGGTGSPDECEQIRRVRDTLQDVMMRSRSGNAANALLTVLIVTHSKSSSPQPNDSDSLTKP